MSHHYLNRPAYKRSNDPVPHTAYQVDFAAKNCGKIVPASKRVIRFKFGYTNSEAMASGKTGQDCRGSEHEVLITWSLSSGKQAIAFDSQEVYFDVGDTTQSKISHAWKDKNGHTLKVKVHAANMSTKHEPDPYWKQYDLFVDGVSFFRMPKIFELGTLSKELSMGSLPLVPSQFNHSVSSNIEFSVPPTSNEDKKAEVIEMHEPKPEPPEVVDLLSFDDFDVPGPAEQKELAQVTSDNVLSQAPTQPNYNSYLLPQEQLHAYNYASPEAQVPVQYQQSYAPDVNNFQAPMNLYENAPSQPTTFAAPTNPFENAPAQPTTFASPTNPFENAPVQPTTFAAPTNPFENAPVQPTTFAAPTNPFENVPAQPAIFSAPTNPFVSSHVQISPPTFAAPMKRVDASSAQYSTATQGHGTPGYQLSFYQASNTYNDTTYVSPNPMSTYDQQPSVVTPPASSTDLNQTQPTSTAFGIDAAVNKLVKFDNHLSTASPAADTITSGLNSHTSIGQLQGNQNPNQKKCVMNPFDAASVNHRHHHQQQHQQQQQVFNKFAAQPPAYNTFIQHAYVQPGYGNQ